MVSDWQIRLSFYLQCDEYHIVFPTGAVYEDKSYRTGQKLVGSGGFQGRADDTLNSTLFLWFIGPGGCC